MLGEKFEIIISLFRNPKRYRMQVEVIYESDQILRFKISAGEKSFEMDKLIFRKTNQWKVKRVNFSTTIDPKTQAEAIIHIQDEIDHYIKANHLS